MLTDEPEPALHPAARAHAAASAGRLTDMRLQITHRTTFTYAGHAHESYNEVRLRPADDATQRCREFTLRIEPAAAARDYHDFYGNVVHTFEVPERHERLVIEAVSLVETQPAAGRGPVPAVSRADFERWGDRELYAEFYSDSALVPLDATLAREARAALGGLSGADLWEEVRRLGHHVYATCDYTPRATRVDTLATEVLNLRKGVCQDFAHLHLGLCRAAGIAARYVSGYFFNTTRRPGEVEASHAWIEAWIPGYGWAGWDATHDRAADERYVKVAVGRDYADIRPVNGTYRGAPGLGLDVEVTVRDLTGGTADEAPALGDPKPV